jgi:predicted ester cyclase
MKTYTHPVIPITVIAICLLTSTACGSPCKEAERNKEVVRKVAGAIMANDYEALDQYMAEDYRRHCQATPDAVVESLEDFKDLMRMYQGAFPADMTLEFLVAEGDLVAVWGKYTGTHTGPMGEIPATGKRVDSDFGGVHRLEDGKIVETWVTWDNVTMLRQLGLFPAQADQAAEGSLETP